MSYPFRTSITVLLVVTILTASVFNWVRGSPAKKAKNFVRSSCGRLLGLWVPVIQSNFATAANIEIACKNGYQTGPTDSESIELWLRSAQFNSFCLSKVRILNRFSQLL